MTRSSRGLRAFIALASFLISASVFPAGVHVEKTLSVDLAPKIEASMAKRERFAVDVPHRASLDEAGSWETAGDWSVWRYSVRIPSAVSMSFHASEFLLPAGALFTVSGATGGTASYSTESGGENGLWSRTLRGDSLTFELRVMASQRSRVRFTIASLQAGYRVLGGGGADHPHYRKLQSTSQALAVAACTRNFSCHETAANKNNADATAAIVIGGVALCTATLVNNLRNDGTPYLLTARHCQDTPQSGVVVYWDATVPCNAQLGSVYDTQTPAYLSGTDTVFEQQDVWLIRLSSPVNANTPYFAGWDATGSTFVGGYSPHHALGRSRQYTEWFGQAYLMTLAGSALGLGYQSTYWGVVNSLGNVGSGASGGGLFNPEHRLVGTASLAYLETGGEGVCPVASPPAPDAITSTTMYNALSSVWESNADTTSSTNPVTLKVLLDPDNTGRRMSDGLLTLTGVRVTAETTSSSTGEPVTISWDGSTATSCTASGGVAGDGWSGPRAVRGSHGVTHFSAGQTTYAIRCTDGLRFGTSSVRINWHQSAPYLFLAAIGSSRYRGESVRLRWRSNLRPCVASGGTPGDGWAGQKNDAEFSQEVAIIGDGVVSYTIACGLGAQARTQTTQVTVLTPLAALSAQIDNMRIGSEVIIMQTASGAICTRSGGAPGDGWTSITNSFPFRARSMTPGTYRYTLTCEGGPTPSVANLDLTFTTDPPVATLTPSKLTAEIANGPIGDIIDGADYPFIIPFTWTSNVAPCQASYDGPGAEDGNVNPQMDQPGAGTFRGLQGVAGTFVYRITCTNGSDTAVATATVEFVPQAPRAFLGLNTELPVTEQPMLLGWASDLTPCEAGGGVAGDGWAGLLTGDIGSHSITISAPGTYTYTLACGVAPNILSRTLTFTVGAPGVRFLSHEAEVLTGRGLILRWESTVGPCTKTHDWAGSSPIATYGTDVVVYSGIGARTYGIRCGTTNVVTTTTQVNYLPMPTVDITASAASVNVNEPVTLNWTSTGASSCTVPGTQQANWGGDLPSSGSRVIERNSPGSQGFYIQCGDASDAVVVEWRSVVQSPAAPPSPTLSFSIDQTQRQAGQAVTLSWTTTSAAACRGSLGVSGDGWAGTLPTSGTRSIVVDAAGTFTWELTCSGAPPAKSARVSATYSNPPASPPTSGGGGAGGGGGGGGGKVDALMLAGLGLMLMFTWRRRTVQSVPFSVLS